MEYRAKSIGTAALLLCVSLASEALTLGNLRGPVVIGRPLDVAIPVQVEQADNAAASCFEAEVFHADVRQAAARVRVSVEPTGVAQSILVRIKSSALINEPVVSVTLRTRCDVQTERRYVLLADLPPAVDLTSPIQIGTVSDASSASASPASNVPPVAANFAASVGSTEAPPAKSARTARSKPTTATNRPLKVAPKGADLASTRAPAPSGQSRLQLDNLELFSDRIALLDQEQPDAAADYVSPDEQKIQDMQGTIQSLQAAAIKNDAILLEMTARLQQSETERFPAWLVFALAGLMLAAIAAAAVLWGRQRRAQAQEGDWWSESIAAPDSLAAPLTGTIQPVSLAPMPAPAVKPKVAAPLESAKTFRQTSQWPDSKNYGVDVNEVEMGESRFIHFLQSGEVHGGSAAKSEAVPAQRAMPHWDNRDAGLIAEIRQQADFFVALGQTDQAVIVLEKLIQDSEVPNPNVFLDLLGLLHSLSKKADFQRYREEFNRVFNVLAPEFVRFRSEGRSLEDYPATLNDVMAHWTTTDVLDCLNAHVLRPPHQLPGSALDLAAFRDLLLLQAIAQQFSTPEMAPSQDLSKDQGNRSSAVAPLSEAQDEPGLVSIMALDLDFSDDAAKPDPSHEAPATFPAALSAHRPASSPKDNLIDFDLSEDIPPLDPRPKV